LEITHINWILLLTYVYILLETIIMQLSCATIDFAKKNPS